MKRFVSLLAVAYVAICFTGCGNDVAATATTETAPDGRPKGFEDMMKGMEKDMQKGVKMPKPAAKKAS